MDEGNEWTAWQFSQNYSSKMQSSWANCTILGNIIVKSEHFMALLCTFVCELLEQSAKNKNKNCAICVFVNILKGWTNKKYFHWRSRIVEFTSSRKRICKRLFKDSMCEYKWKYQNRHNYRKEENTRSIRENLKETQVIPISRTPFVIRKQDWFNTGLIWVISIPCLKKLNEFDRFCICIKFIDFFLKQISMIPIFFVKKNNTR